MHSAVDRVSAMLSVQTIDFLKMYSLYFATINGGVNKFTQNRHGVITVSREPCFHFGRKTPFFSGI